MATVRPETMLGDTAVAVNPDDERYRDLIGHDGHAAAGGPRDPDRRRRLRRDRLRHRRPQGHAGPRPQRLRDRAPPRPPGRRRDRRGRAHDRPTGGRYAGLDPAEARERVVADLRAQGAHPGEEPYTHTVPFSHRSGARVEPLVSLQWFCDMTASPRRRSPPSSGAGCASRRPSGARSTSTGCARSARGASAASSGGATSSRSGTGASETVASVDARPPEGEGWVRDQDVLDTWFSSALWPFATLGWPRADARAGALLPDPGALDRARHHLPVGRPHGDDGRASTWARSPSPTSTSTRSCRRRRPAHEQVARHRHRPDGPDRAHGADALRFGLLMMSSTQDVRYSADRIDQGRQLVTKLWNAARLVVDRGGRGRASTPRRPATLADRWIASRVAGGRRAVAGPCSRASSSRSSPTSSTTWSSTTTATGTWSC